ncbi:MAG TPA: ABC transporter permease [Polyangiaceae bacterium]|jgi:ABC-type dipeptide/oligopeptide/nickel transport system permease subunit
MTGVLAVGAVAAFAVLGPLAAGHDPLASDFVNGMAPDGLPVGPSARFLLGTDRLFRDVFARLAVAGRLSLWIALSATAIATCIGAVVGIAAGWLEGRRAFLPWPAAAGLCGALACLALGRPGLACVALVAAAIGWRWSRPRGLPVNLDAILMRLVDILLAFPFLLLVMAIGTSVGHTSAVTVFLTLGATGWLGIARILRAKTMQVRTLEYIDAARALGRPTLGILVSHVLPNVAGPLIVTATMLVGQMIVADSVLSYLGVGLSPPTPTWGRMLLEGQDALATSPWLVAAPGAAIVLSVWGFTMLGEGLRDALDPHDA